MDQKHVVITGASVGIGAACARLFSANGARVTLLARRIDKLKSLQEELGPSVSVHSLDLTQKSAVLKTLEAIQEKASIDVLINNAGAAYSLDPAHKANLEDWEACVALNISGLLYATYAVLPEMVKRNQGHIINLGSIAAHYPYPGGNVYGATKSFVHQFTLNLRADLLGSAVRVSCIEPGMVGGTEFSEVRFKGDLEKAQKVYAQTTPLQPEDIAQTIFFCTNVPPHVNINTLEVMPVMQAFSSTAVYRHT